MIPLAIAHTRPDPLPLGTGQQDVEIEYALERSGSQVGAVEKYRERPGLFAEALRIGGDLIAYRSIERCADPLPEIAVHTLTKVSSGPCSIR